MTKKRETTQTGLELGKVRPLTERQKNVFDDWSDGYHLILHGWAGTGKTFLGLYLALLEMQTKPKDFDRIIIVRSSVPSRDMGFLPGSITEKAAAYEEPYEATVNSLYGRGDAYGIMKKRGIIEFRTTSYLRGLTYDKAIVIVDEIQNMNMAELDTIMTRIGETTRIIFSGDYRQTDLQKDKEKEGLKKFLRILTKLNDFSHIEFGIEDIVRSEIVKKYIIAKTTYEDGGN